jgi:hypothetical protein
MLDIAADIFRAVITGVIFLYLRKSAAVSRNVH